MILLTTIGFYHWLHMFRPFPSWLERFAMYHQPADSYRFDGSLGEGLFCLIGDCKTLLYNFFNIFHLLSYLSYLLFDLCYRRVQVFLWRKILLPSGEITTRLAEGEGFEPSRPCGLRAFQARALDRAMRPFHELAPSRGLEPPTFRFGT